MYDYDHALPIEHYGCVSRVFDRIEDPVLVQHGRSNGAIWGLLSLLPTDIRREIPSYVLIFTETDVPIVAYTHPCQILNCYSLALILQWGPKIIDGHL